MEDSSNSQSHIVFNRRLTTTLDGARADVMLGRPLRCAVPSGASGHSKTKLESSNEGIPSGGFDLDGVSRLLCGFCHGTVSAVCAPFVLGSNDFGRWGAVMKKCGLWICSFSSSY